MSIAAKLKGYLDFLFPVRSSEFKKFLPMFFMNFFLTINYNLLKTIKDSIIVSAAGAEAIPFIKVWVMFPMAVFMTAFFTFLSQKYSQKRVFYTLMSIFLVSIGSFLIILFPLREIFFLHSVAQKLSGILPSGLHGLIEVVRYWPLAIFYTMAELWGSIVLFVLFWGFANRAIGIEEAKRFYPLFGVAANSSGFFAPHIFLWAADNPTFFDLPFLATSWEKSLFLMGWVVLAAGVISIAIFWWLENNVFTKESNELAFAKSSYNKIIGFFESIQYLLKFKYIRNMAIIVIVYNISINLTEVIWKGEVHKLCPDPKDFGSYMSQVMIVTSLLAIFSDLFISSNLIRKFGWTTTAMITPIVILVTSIIFFAFLIFDLPYESNIAAIFGVSMLSLSTFFGSLQNVFARASKYSLFDVSKEIAFIPLDNDAKMRSKAAIDGVGSRLGKSGGAVILQGLFLFVGNLSASFVYVAFALGSLLSFWCIAVLKLGRQFKELTSSEPDNTLGNKNNQEAQTSAISESDALVNNPDAMKKAFNAL